MHTHEGAKCCLDNMRTVAADMCMLHFVYKLHLTFWVNF